MSPIVNSGFRLLVALLLLPHLPALAAPASYTSPNPTLKHGAKRPDLRSPNSDLRFPQHIATLIDPAKLATLGERGANPRVQKVVYWLATAQMSQ